MIPQRRLNNLLGWLVACLATGLYLATLEPSVSFWDCGEFIAISHKFEIGHPPGAPLYQLLAHCFTLLAAGDVAKVAWCCNALSAVAGGVTAMFLFWTLVRLIARFPHASERPWRIWFSALVGTACYTFCDTAWFSAVESEVYSLSMAFSAAIVWAAVRWAQCDDNSYRPRWMLLVLFLTALSFGVHQLSLLTIPAVLLIIIFRLRNKSACPTPDGRQSHRMLRRRSLCHTAPLCVVYILIGVTPYLILPIRAKEAPPINQGNPSTWSSFKAYIGRDQYEKAPLLYGRCFNSPIVAYNDGKPQYAKEMDMLFPRMWAQHPHAEQYYTDWVGRHGKMVTVDGKEYYKPSFVDNATFFFSYQLGYMYFRYLMWNFSGRFDDQQGFGNLHRGQLITGIPPIDKLYLGTSRAPVASMPHTAHNRYFMLPLLLGIIGLFACGKRDKRTFWVVMTLFVTSGILLSIYLNHPIYEPRERDYAYVLSFYAFAMWIAAGAYAVLSWRADKKNDSKVRLAHQAPKAALLLAIPALMAFQNWDDHDRSHRYVARDSAFNLLNSCAPHAILLTYGDNDTFPLWYLQEVEGIRTDVQIVNVSLLGAEEYTQAVKQAAAQKGYDIFSGEEWRQMGPYRRVNTLIATNGDERPVYMSHYAFADMGSRYKGATQLCGIAYRLGAAAADSVDYMESYRLMTQKLHWSPLEGVYLDETSRGFLRQYWKDAVLVAENLIANNKKAEAATLLDTTEHSIPPDRLSDLPLMLRIATAYGDAGQPAAKERLMRQLRHDLAEQLDFYSTMKPAMQQYVAYSIQPLLHIDSTVNASR